MASEAQKKPPARFRQVSLKLNLAADADILEKLAAAGNIQGYIKALIRRDLHGAAPPERRTKTLASGRLRKLIRQNARGADAKQDAGLDLFAVKYDLSAREKEVFRLLLKGQSNAMIAERLYVTESTVKFHVHHLLQKTGAKSRRELVNRCSAVRVACTDDPEGWKGEG